MKMTKLICPRCGKEWDYNGQNKWFARCPDCKKDVKIKQWGE